MKQYYIDGKGTIEKLFRITIDEEFTLCIRYLAIAINGIRIWTVIMGGREYMQITVNQHYVPRFYMKHFANVKNIEQDNEKALISFYQFKDNMLKENIPTKTVCSEDFFYDRDGRIEKSLANKENKWSRAIQNALDSQITMDDEESIREFVVYQICRTKAMLDHNREMVTSIMQGTLNQKFGDMANEEDIKKHLENKIQNEITPEFCLSIVKEIIPVIRDLNMKIITNETEVKFITSDVPVIIMNPLGIDNAGLDMIGEVIFFPISPQKIIVFYDAKIFDIVPDKIYDESVIEVFNYYQYISADERLLAKELATLNYIANNEELNSKREQFHQRKKTDTVENGIGSFFAAKSRSIPYYYNISVFRLPRSLRKIPNEFRETFPREYSNITRISILCRIYKSPDFIHSAEEKKYWKKRQEYSKIILYYLDNYWNTPKNDRTITPELMYKLKTVPVNTFRINQS